MNYEIKIADINDPAIDLALRNLIKAAYNSTDTLPDRYLAANLQSNASKPGLFLVAEQNNEIIGCTGFLANDFILNDIAYSGYQCCWAVTHPDHQGKKIFTGIINEAKKILKEQGAGFLYAISNARSTFTFTKKLDFRETPSLGLRIPHIPLLHDFYFTKKLPQNKNACTIDEEQVEKHKAAQYPAEIKIIRYNNSWLWGKLARKNKFGIKLRVFYVGGIQLSNGKDLKGLVHTVFKDHHVLFVQFLSCKTNTFNSMLRGWKRSASLDFVYFNLNMPEFEHLNLMIGPLDVF